MIAQVPVHCLPSPSSSITSTDLALQSIVVLVFFPTYVIFQPPATVLSRRLGPRKFLASICLLWGAIEIVSIFHGMATDDGLTLVQAFGFVNKWTELLGLRVLLGILESGLYPSIVYLLATWYSRCKLPCRLMMNLTVLFRRCGKTLFSVLRYRLSRFCIWRHSSLWTHADGRPRRQDRLAMDLHYRRTCKPS